MPNNSTPVLVDRFYPILATVVNEDEILEILGFVKEGIVFLFDKIHFEECVLIIVITL